MGSLKKLNRYFKKYKWTIVFGSIFLMASNFFLVWIPVFLRRTVNQISELELDKSADAFHSVSMILFDSSASWPLAKNALFLIGAAALSGLLLFATRQTLIIASRKIEFDCPSFLYVSLLVFR